jgi:formylglycine-generating enzyme required for sulfatase activity
MEATSRYTLKAAVGVWIMALICGCSQRLNVDASLVKCYVCGQRISPRASACPHCGEPVTKPVSSMGEMTNSIGMRLTRLPAGEFMMGSPDSEFGRSAEEGPLHQVKITYSFAISVHEVTVKQFSMIMGKEDGTPEGSSEFPATLISWDNAVEFCNRLTNDPEEARHNRKYRLPTEAEWEYACRGGSVKAFSFGDRFDISKANCKSVPNSTIPSGPRKVGSFPANRFGLFDMHGNAWEWCSDYFDAAYYAQARKNDPAGPAEGTLRVLRGGGWNASPTLSRSAFRDGNEPTIKRSDYGFRVVCVDSNREVSSVANTPSQPLADAAFASKPRDLADVIESVEPAVVRINTHGRNSSGYGSGFLLDHQGTIVTNYHVIEDANEATATFSDGEITPIVGYVMLSKEKDVAILRLSDFKTTRKPLLLATDLPKKGETTIAFGAPLGLSFTASDGIVSAVRRHEELEEVTNGLDLNVTWIQTTSPISPGNSGGPLVNVKGEVIGINTINIGGAKEYRGQNLNFAVSARDVQSVFQEGAGTVTPLSAESSGLSEQIETLIRELRRMQGDK